MRQKELERQEAIARLKESVKPGDTVYTQLKHVSRSGMLRVIQVVKMEDNRPLYLGYNVAAAVDMPYDRKKEGVRIGGVGMDMGFALVYDLSYQLFKDGFDCIGAGCPANDHSNGDRDYTPHKHSDAGYALKQRWL